MVINYVAFLRQVKRAGKVCVSLTKGLRVGETLKGSNRLNSCWPPYDEHNFLSIDDTIFSQWLYFQLSFFTFEKMEWFRFHFRISLLIRGWKNVKLAIMNEWPYTEKTQKFVDEYVRFHSRWLITFWKRKNSRKTTPFASSSCKSRKFAPVWGTKRIIRISF